MDAGESPLQGELLFGALFPGLRPGLTETVLQAENTEMLLSRWNKSGAVQLGERRK